MGKSSSQLSRRQQELKNNNTDEKTAKRKRTTMEAEESGGTASLQRFPLSDVVSDCVNRWFQDTLKEAKSGDINMQVLVGQMYYCGYGVAKDANKGKIWITRASRVRASAWKVCNKRPGYNASDSDSDDLADDS
ncbi:hypothetical protein ACJIZ3_019041 [Penstemon smallii]|uniref:Uncharacterized protein n=1 Tax=Penstemon smallii TaxID=265156 RepID=A0ABD3T031_9LAMI